MNIAVSGLINEVDVCMEYVPTESIARSLNFSIVSTHGCSTVSRPRAEILSSSRAKLCREQYIVTMVLSYVHVDHSSPVIVQVVVHETGKLIVNAVT